METMTTAEGESLDIVHENVEVLKGLFPEAFTEDGINFETLRQLFGDEIADGEEKYGLTWFGKKKARQIALTPSTGTLRPCPDESVDWETTQSLFIEGDNLEVLKLLQKSYAGQVKMIFIDPPYNTGGEFIYPDRFQENLETYLRYTGQKGDEGFKTASNTETSGRFHTNWLNMMYPRLKLAKNLLKPKGAIFVSIDDNEVANLRAIMDEIFGEENFLTQIEWQKRYTRSNNTDNFTSVIDHILLYQKSDEFKVNLVERDDEANARFTNPDNDPRGPWKATPFLNQVSPEKRPNLCYPITNPHTGSVANPTKKAWRYEKKYFEKLLAEDRLWWGKDKTKEVPDIKTFLSEVRQGMTPINFWDHKFAGNTDDANREIKALLEEKIFDTPKPTKLITRMIEHACQDDDLILDFFAGSASTGDAVMRKNASDGGTRRFILVQLPEKIDEGTAAHRLGYRNIADIGKERLRRAAVAIKEENADYEGDLGFKVFKLDSSNIRAWSPLPSDLEQTLLDHVEHLVEGRTEQDVLYELLLKRGVDLTVPIEEKEIARKTVYSIGFGVLFACLDKTIDKSEIEALGQGITVWHKELKPAADTQVVFRDSAFADDIAKTNMTAILEQNGIAHVRSL